ncbi:MAG TPA: hypothetical protein VHA80_06945 [Solirubrobacterales bacterium]|nr:hypothetical protein [Solirubrobacterales bacterium]
MRTAQIELRTACLGLVGNAAAILRLPAVEAGLFALGGVIVGGVLNGLVAWILARHTARSNARVAALLVNEELMQSVPALLGLREHKTWGWLSVAHEFGRRDAWDENRAILGHAIDPDAYMAIAAGYSGLTSARDTAARGDFSAPITDVQGESLATTYLTINRGLSYLGPLLHRPSWWHPRARRAFDRKTRQHIRSLLEKDRKYQDFMAKHGRNE